MLGTDLFNFYVLTALFPVRADKLGKIENFHTCLLLHKIYTGEMKIVTDVPESGVIHTSQWVGERWRTKYVRVNWRGLTYASI